MLGDRTESAVLQCRVDVGMNRERQRERERERERSIYAEFNSVAL